MGQSINEMSWKTPTNRWSVLIPVAHPVKLRLLETENWIRNAPSYTTNHVDLPEVELLIIDTQPNRPSPKHQISKERPRSSANHSHPYMRAPFCHRKRDTPQTRRLRYRPIQARHRRTRQHPRRVNLDIPNGFVEIERGGVVVPVGPVRVGISIKHGGGAEGGGGEDGGWVEGAPDELGVHGYLEG